MCSIPRGSEGQRVWGKEKIKKIGNDPKKYEKLFLFSDVKGGTILCRFHFRTGKLLICQHGRRGEVKNGGRKEKAEGMHGLKEREMGRLHKANWATYVALRKTGSRRKGGMKDEKVISNRKSWSPKRLKRNKDGEKQGLTDQIEVCKHQSARKTSPWGATDHSIWKEKRGVQA